VEVTLYDPGCAMGHEGNEHYAFALDKDEFDAVFQRLKGSKYSIRGRF